MDRLNLFVFAGIAATFSAAAGYSRHSMLLMAWVPLGLLAVAVVLALLPRRSADGK
jgi:hypothetical protein